MAAKIPVDPYRVDVPEEARSADFLDSGLTFCAAVGPQPKVLLPQ